RLVAGGLRLEVRVLAERGAGLLGLGERRRADRHAERREDPAELLDLVLIVRCNDHIHWNGLLSIYSKVPRGLRPVLQKHRTARRELRGALHAEQGVILALPELLCDRAAPDAGELRQAALLELRDGRRN